MSKQADRRFIPEDRLQEYAEACRTRDRIADDIQRFIKSVVDSKPDRAQLVVLCKAMQMEFEDGTKVECTLSSVMRRLNFLLDSAKAAVDAITAQHTGDIE